MNTRPWQGRPGVVEDPAAPAVWIGWDDAEAFIAKLGSLTGESFRIPTEAEWEYACRAGTTGPWSFGSDEDKAKRYAWSKEVAGGTAHAARRLGANAFGLFDMHGNVWEWCADRYDGAYYAASPSRDPAGPATGAKRVARGGSYGEDRPACRSANREAFEPTSRRDSLGLRVARTLPR